jgi:N-(5-amino-5-carboxypentanoyl)-L-cysteinyl-D-valine synthase
MPPPRSTPPIKDWIKLLDQISGERCDLDVLLRDEWRHKIVARDDGSPRAMARRTITLAGTAYAAMKEQTRPDDGASLGALSLATLHTSLGAFAHGNKTVIVFMDAIGAASATDAKILPTVVDLTEHSTTCGEAAAKIEHALRDKDAYEYPDVLLRRGLFDTALVLTDRDLSQSELPPTPLVALVQNDELGGCLRWTMLYATELFDDLVIGGVLDIVREVFLQYAACPKQLVRDVELISEDQKQQLAAWNATHGNFPEDKRLNELFEDCVQREPDREAVVFESEHLTYCELNERSNQLAHWLVSPAVGITSGDRIGLYLDKSHLGVIATFAIWKAGAAYVPIDPTCPAERLRFTIADTNPIAIITNRQYVTQLSEILDAEGLMAITIEIESVLGANGGVVKMSRQNPSLELSSEALAYVTYTSGTTGIPKGVPKNHRSVVNSITDLSQRYDMQQPGQERVALFASYVFEPHLRQTLIALINGQTLIVVPDNIRLDPDLLPAYLAKHHVTYLNATGSVLQHFDLRSCSCLKKVLLVGEELTSAGLRKLRAHFSGHIINEYAFTESAFVTAVKEFAPGTMERTNRSIGRPLRNVTWYVLSRERKQVPIGATGELYIGGCGVAPGYLNQPDLTSQAFLPNPFQSERDKLCGHNDRIYRTGDLARVLPNGEVEYLGRADFQLKINGVRIEPGEIETRALEYPGVQECVVVARKVSGRAGDRCLVGYYVVDPKVEIAETDLLVFLERQLIQIMVPSRMIRLVHMPLNVNGKIDRRALPEPELNVQDSPSDDHLEGLIATLRDIWSAVLGIPAERIKDSDDFFRLGGQSISCILLIARIRQYLHRSIGVEEVFRLRTFGNLAERLACDGQLELTADLHPGVDEEPIAAPPLANGLQQGLLYHAMKSQEGDDAYVVQSVFRYQTAIRPDLMKEAWRHARRKYPSLRLRFELGELPLQIIEPDDGPLDWRYVDLSEQASLDDQQANIERLREADRAERYYPLEGGLFRVYLIKQREDLFTLVFSCHHIVIDGWSLTILHDQVHRVYLDLAEGRTIQPEEDLAYLDAQRYWQAHRHDHVDYWTKQIERIEERGDYNGLLNAHSRYRVSLNTYDRVRERKSKKLRLGADLTSALAEACAANEVTLHSVLQFVWHKALSAIGDCCSTVLGTIVSGRYMPIDGIDSSVGLFINTLPLVVDHESQTEQCVAAAIADIQMAVNTMNAKSIVALGRLQSGTMKRHLFDALLVLENYPRLLDDAEERRHLEQLRFEKSFDADRVDHPMAVVGREEGDELTITLWYAGEIFEETAIDALLEMTRILFLQVARDMSQPVSNLEFLTPPMVGQMDAWNDTEVEFPDDKTLNAVFQDAAANWPEETAVVYKDRSLTYRELNEYANQLAHHLRTLMPLRADDLIALVMDKSEFMIAAIIAVWKTGAAYVPIDPEYPDERIAFMLEDTDARLVLVNREYTDRLRNLEAAGNRLVVAIEDVELHGEPCDNLVTETKSTDLAYAIYTSGTTGSPKAVLIEHRGVVNLQSSLARLFRLDKRHGDEAVLSYSNYVFDHFVEVIIDALLNGQKLVVLDDRMRTDERRLFEYMNENQVTYLSGTPSVLSLYDFSAAKSLRRIDAIGEEFTEPVFAKIRATFPHGLIVNGYGPTEISITSHKRLYGTNDPRLDKSIGFQVANTRCYVLNGARKRVPVGGVGELYIGGVGVARGYLNRPDLTAERFIDNPFQTPEEKRKGNNGRLYKTGDLARWLPNGEVEYLGRTDLQVKIRGQRVELGEVESVLASCPGVARALVIARENPATAGSIVPQKYLVGFYIGERELDELDVKRWMRLKLSDGLVPARIMRITGIPVTPSGKLDIKRLPETEFAPEVFVPFAAPATDVEIQLCGVWSRVLGIAPECIGINDDFFALGGDSIRAMALAQAVTSTFDYDVGVAMIFQDTTIAAQAGRIQKGVASRAGGEAGSSNDIVGVRVERPPVSFAQERLLFIDGIEGGTAAYNVPFVLCLANISARAVIEAGRALIRRHAALCTLVRASENGLYRQFILSEESALASFQVEEVAVGSRAELDFILHTEATQVFRLGEDLPVRATLVSVAGLPDKVFLSLVFHHICFDGWSWDIFRRELAVLLGGASETELPALRVSYADFAIWQRQYLSGPPLLELTEYWKDALAGFEPVRLPLDFPRPPRFDYRGREVPFELDSGTTDALRALARSVRVSLYSVLLAAWSLMLWVYTGQRDLVVGTPSANRGRPEFSGIVGLLANLLAVRVRVNHTATLTDYVRDVGAAVIAAQIHAELPFEQLIKELNVEKDFSRHPVVQVNFTLLPRIGPVENGGVLSDYAPDNRGVTSVKFDLSAMLQEVSAGLAGTVTYGASLFKDSTVNGFITTFKHILRQLAQVCHTVEPIRVCDIAWTEAFEVPAVGLSATTPLKVGSALPRTLHALFERAAGERADEVAVASGDTHLTFGELNERANQLARHLRATIPLRSRDLIALALDKNWMMIVAILGVWKAGAGYVPIGPDHPDDRIAFMLEDTKARLVLTNRRYSERLRRIFTDTEAPVLDLEMLPFDNHSPTNPVVPSTDTDLAYAIYTSGTTGRPKAVLITHLNAISFYESLRGRFFQADGKSWHSVLFLANYVFDFSIEQLMLSVLSGNKLVIPPTTSGSDLYNYVEREELTYLSGTPTQILQLDLSRLKHLSGVLVAGEPFLRHHFDQIRRQYSGPVYNAYGTTETTVYNTVKCFELGEGYRNDLGEPLPNTQLYVLDDTLKPLPPGAPGELYIAGECVSDGYLNEPEFTAARFLPNHLRTAAETRNGRFPVLYKTGDLVRRCLDGELRFLGRNDEQLKIRGLRIESGEIEAAIMFCPGVRQCAVVVRDDRRSLGEKQLVAYYVPESSASIDDTQVLAALRAKLPPSMVPSLLMRLDQPLPLTINGKLDTEALPDVAFSAGQSLYAGPRSRLEARLCRLWSEQLPVAAVGIDDDFFRSGGDSISALRLASRVQRETSFTVSARDIFDFPSVRAFVGSLLSRAEDSLPVQDMVPEHDKPEPLSGECPMLPIQRWFFAKPLTDRARWNQNFAIRTKPLDTARLREALGKLVDHHEAFWLRYSETASGPQQFYANHCPAVVLHTLDVRHLPEPEIQRWLGAWQSVFNLESGPTYCVAYLHGFEDGSARIWFAMHHLIVDVVSWRIITQDLEILYHGGTLGARSNIFCKWSRAVQDYKPGDEELRLWDRITQAVEAERSDNGLVVQPQTTPRCERFRLTATETQYLLTESAWAYDTEVSDLLLTAIGYALQSLTSRAVNHVTVEGHGRELFEGAPDVRDTVSWFTTMHPVPVAVGPNLEQSILLTKTNRRRAPHHGLGYGAHRGTYGSENAPLPPVTFNYLGRLESGESRPAVTSGAWLLDVGTWTTSSGVNGESASDSVIDITMSCVDGQLATVIDSKLDEPATQRFTAELEASLRKLIAHTGAVTRSGGSGRVSGAAATEPQEVFVPYILVNNETPGRTLFLLPPGEGGAESYLSNLARHLPGHRLVIFNNLHLHTPGESFEALAEYYVEHVLRIQARGPYSFLGWSFGGVLSLEMANQLARTGSRIDNLLLIDSYFNVPQAMADIGLPSVEDLLDPINYRYRPSRADLDRLGERTGSIVLFKAGEPNDIITSEDQCRLFEYYLRTGCNNLDTLLPDNTIRVEVLPGQSHHSWVRDQAAVEAMGRFIVELLEAT